MAIETSCRIGSAALGAGDELLTAVDFDAASRHAAQLVTRLAELLKSHELTPADLGEVYVSVGPGSFTGTRVAVTVARMLAQTVPGLRTVAVPTAAAVAEGAAELDWHRLGVIFDAREGLIYAASFSRDADGRPVADGPEGVMTPEEYLAAVGGGADAAGEGEPIRLIGEGLAYHEMPRELILAPDELNAPPHLPNARYAWHVGRRMAAAGEFTEYHRLEPLYCRKPEAVRAWERAHGGKAPH